MQVIGSLYTKQGYSWYLTDNLTEILEIIAYFIENQWDYFTLTGTNQALALKQSKFDWS